MEWLGTGRFLNRLILFAFNDDPVAVPVEALRDHMDFVADGRNQRRPGEKLKNRIFLGSDEFVASLHRTLDPDASQQEIPAV
jgi:hypothetical protein